MYCRKNLSEMYMEMLEGAYFVKHRNMKPKFLRFFILPLIFSSGGALRFFNVQCFLPNNCLLSFSSFEAEPSILYIILHVFVSVCQVHITFYAKYIYFLNHIVWVYMECHPALVNRDK